MHDKISINISRNNKVCPLFFDLTVNLLSLIRLLSCLDNEKIKNQGAVMQSQQFVSRFAYIQNLERFVIIR